MDINILLFDEFEPLDVFGPAEVFLHAEQFNVQYFTLSNKRAITSYRLPIVDLLSDEEIDTSGVLLIPGGPGTRLLVNDKNFIGKLKILIDKSTYCLSICTGSALLAMTTTLDHKRATSNKLAFNWVTSLNSKILWQRHARWTMDDKFYTSSGVSAGIDMSFAFLEHVTTRDFADNVAHDIEYVRIRDSQSDPFS